MHSQAWLRTPPNFIFVFKHFYTFQSLGVGDFLEFFGCLVGFYLRFYLAVEKKS